MLLVRLEEAMLLVCESLFLLLPPEMEGVLALLLFTVVLFLAMDDEALSDDCFPATAAVGVLFLAMDDETP
jgi:hypothetical protein